MCEENYKFLFQDNDNLKRKKKRRPAAKPFDPEAIRAIGGEVTSDGDFLIFEGNRYSLKGFLYKNFNMNAIIADGTKSVFFIQVSTKTRILIVFSVLRYQTNVI